MYEFVDDWLITYFNCLFTSYEMSVMFLAYSRRSILLYNAMRIICRGLFYSDF